MIVTFPFPLDSILAPVAEKEGFQNRDDCSRRDSSRDPGPLGRQSQGSDDPDNDNRT